MRRSEIQPTVLVVDDEAEVADVYAKHLSESYAVRTAYSGDEAVALLNPDVDVVLLDRRMPDMSGDEVLTHIRSQRYDCFVVFLTAVQPTKDILTLDFDEYLTKPVSPGELHEIVETMLSRREYVRQVRDAIALASKLATLEAKMDIAELEASDEYAALLRQFEELRGEVGSPPEEGTYSALAREKLQALFE